MNFIKKTKHLNKSMYVAYKQISKRVVNLQVVEKSNFTANQAQNKSYYKKAKQDDLGLMKFVLTIILAICPLMVSAQLHLLNDEFNDASTFTDWQTVNDVEGWNATHLEQIDINTTTSGNLVMMPYTTGWYQDWRSVLFFKEVTGDFVFTTEVTTTNRAGTGIPNSDYSLAGPMIRTPRNFNNGAAGWTAGGENYVFLSIGYAHHSHPSLPVTPTPGPHFEVKSTVNSNSNLRVAPIGSHQNVQIRLVRVNGYVICLYREPGQNWVVHQRYSRSDFPDTVQVGLVTYTDWGKVSTYTPIFLNSNTINANLNPDPSSNPGQPFNPDLIGTFDFARFDDVSIPPALASADLTDIVNVPDYMLLDFLGYDSEAYNPCPYDMIIDQATVLQSVMQVENNISTLGNVTVTNGQVVRFLTNDMDLNQDFQINLGAETEIINQPCTP